MNLAKATKSSAVQRHRAEREEVGLVAVGHHSDQARRLPERHIRLQVRLEFCAARLGWIAPAGGETGDGGRADQGRTAEQGELGHVEFLVCHAKDARSRADPTTRVRIP